jgi:hypothetical protein
LIASTGEIATKPGQDAQTGFEYGLEVLPPLVQAWAQGLENVGGAAQVAEGTTVAASIR